MPQSLTRGSAFGANGASQPLHVGPCYSSDIRSLFSTSTGQYLPRAIRLLCPGRSSFSPVGQPVSSPVCLLSGSHSPSQTSVLLLSRVAWQTHLLSLPGLTKRCSPQPRAMPHLELSRDPHPAGLPEPPHTVTHWAGTSPSSLCQDQPSTHASSILPPIQFSRLQGP